MRARRRVLAAGNWVCACPGPCTPPLDELPTTPRRPQIEFPHPNESSRADILKIHSRKMNLTRGIDLKKVCL